MPINDRKYENPCLKVKKLLYLSFLGIETGLKFGWSYTFSWQKVWTSMFKSQKNTEFKFSGKQNLVFIKIEIDLCLKVRHYKP